ncbi:hypothetical protein HJC23_009989 [Cyclotella cryptica]|uniref:Uncharacterized protein n=1 Tax=Cyclotella cryptica TaxID=29204 RepID=A0ABD3Q876_9STRA|eukprot:CCRYP_007752-RA/>CCRYP_007752-RA protein AED:0.48 eAED:0.48 QI:0/-1/0/1/-1/1/1/0/76
MAVAPPKYAKSRFASASVNNPDPVTTASFATVTSLRCCRCPVVPDIMSAAAFSIPSIIINRRAERSAALRSDPSRE